jgi:hypothetical protein
VWEVYQENAKANFDLGILYVISRSWPNQVWVDLVVFCDFGPILDYEMPRADELIKN